VSGQGKGSRPNEARRRQVARLRDAGLTLAEIGERLGVSHVAVCCMLQRMGHESPPAVFTCAGCRRKVASSAALPADCGAALCLPCLRKRPGAPFAQRLRALRLAAGLTKKELARRAGLTRLVVRKYEAGSLRPRPASLTRLVGVLGPRLLPPGQARAK
jgi:transcriptional regulator with XRE-family HTH domain